MKIVDKNMLGSILSNEADYKLNNGIRCSRYIEVNTVMFAERQGEGQI